MFTKIGMALSHKTIKTCFFQEYHYKSKTIINQYSWFQFCFIQEWPTSLKWVLACVAKCLVVCFHISIIMPSFRRIHAVGSPEEISLLEFLIIMDYWPVLKICKLYFFFQMFMSTFSSRWAISILPVCIRTRLGSSSKFKQFWEELHS